MALAILVPTRTTISAFSFVAVLTTLLCERNCLYSVFAMSCTCDSDTSDNWLRPVIALRVQEEITKKIETISKSGLFFITDFLIQFKIITKIKPILIEQSLKGWW